MRNRRRATLAWCKEVDSPGGHITLHVEASPRACSPANAVSAPPNPRNTRQAVPLRLSAYGVMSFCSQIPTFSASDITTARQAFCKACIPAIAAIPPATKESNCTSMFSRITQVARHLSAPSFSHIRTASAKMAFTEARGTRSIRTAACLIIGDEVLGGKASRIN